MKECDNSNPVKESKFSGGEAKCYKLYGRVVKSEYPLPLSTVTGETPDIVIIDKGIIPKTKDPSQVKSAKVWSRDESDYILTFYNIEGHIIEFRINHQGTRIQLSQSWPNRQDSLFVLLNPAMAAALHLQGKFLLHAASLVYNGTAFLISGESEAGKSTLSAALAAEEVAIHSDDISVIEEQGGKHVVPAGYPRIKMKPDSADVLNLPMEKMMSIVSIESDDSERWIASKDLPGGYHAGTAPLGGIFLLSDRDNSICEPRIEKLAPAAAGLVLATHRYGRDWLDHSETRILQFCTRIAGSTPVYRINLPDNINLLKSSARRLIEQYMNPLVHSS